MPTLILLNGPPASGKSTLAARLVSERPLALNLDIDVVRSLVGGWLDQPHDAGLAARALAVEMARTHLESGRDVVVPQYVGRLPFIEQLDAVATATGATFIEAMLVLDRREVIAAFEERSRAPTAPAHVDAAALVARSRSADPIGAMVDGLEQVRQKRPSTLLMPVVRGDVDATFEALLARLYEHGLGPAAD